MRIFLIQDQFQPYRLVTVCFRSDVWSFGILMFEVLSIGEMPYSRVKMADYKSRMKAEWE